MEKNKLNQLEERPIWVFRLLHTHPRCILWEFHACLLGFLELSSSKLLKKTPLPTSKRHQLMSVIGNVMELSILRSFFKPYKSLPFSKLSRKVHPIDLIPKSWGQPRCGSLTIDVQRMPLNGVKMETPFQKWFKPPPSGKHNSPEIHFQGNLSMGPCVIAMLGLPKGTLIHVVTSPNLANYLQLLLHDRVRHPNVYLIVSDNRNLQKNGHRKR